MLNMTGKQDWHTQMFEKLTALEKFVIVGILAIHDFWDI